MRKDAIPLWPCQGCTRPTLGIVDGTYRQEWDSKTLANRKYRESDPTDDSGYFTVMLQCRSCSAFCAVSGRIATDFDCDETGGTCLVPIGWPNAMSPAPAMIRIPNDCPGPIKDELLLAFSLYWADLGACLT